MGLIYFLYQGCLDPIAARGYEKLGEESGADSRNLHGLGVQGCVTGASLGSWLRVVMKSKDTVHWPQVVAEFFVWSWERRTVWEIQRATGISLFKIYSPRIWNFKILWFVCDYLGYKVIPLPLYLLKGCFETFSKRKQWFRMYKFVFLPTKLIWWVRNGGSLSL